MHFRPLPALVALVLLAAVPVAMRSQAPASSLSSSKPAPGTTIETAHATFALSSSITRLRPGARVSLYVDVSPKPNIHLYAPGEKENLPIALTIPRNRAYTLRVPTFPTAQTYVFPPLKLTQLVYSTPFRITQPLTIVKPPSSGSLTIAGTIRYQACDDTVCYVPKTVDVSWAVSGR